MKIIICLIGCLVAGSWLFKTNPKEKKPYLDHAARQLQADCCLATSASTFDSCQLLRPLTQPLMRSVLLIYTDPPSDYQLFTVYTTRLPTRQTIRGVGIGGQIYVWNHLATDTPNPCATFYDSLSTQPLQRSFINCLPQSASFSLSF